MCSLPNISSILVYRSQNMDCMGSICTALSQMLRAELIKRFFISISAYLSHKVGLRTSTCKDRSYTERALGCHIIQENQTKPKQNKTKQNKPKQTKTNQNKPKQKQKQKQKHKNKNTKTKTKTKNNSSTCIAVLLRLLPLTFFASCVMNWETKHNNFSSVGGVKMIRTVHQIMTGTVITPLFLLAPEAQFLSNESQMKNRQCVCWICLFLFLFFVFLFFFGFLFSFSFSFSFSFLF